MRETLLACLVCGLLFGAPLHAAGQEDERRERDEQMDADALRERLRRQAPRQTEQGERPLPELPPRNRLPEVARPSIAPVSPPRGATAQPDSVMEALRRLDGYTVTTYSGGSAEFDADSGSVDLGGAATLEREGQVIEADSLLTFDRESGVVCGYGSPVLSGEGQPINSDQICYDTERRLGMALGARTEFSQGATWFVHGERVFTAGSNAIYSAGAEFTTCDLDVPHYHFRAARFKMLNDEIMVARDVTLNFGEVPVFWLPFLVQSLRQGRRSGLLTPSFGVSDIVQTSSRHTREVRNLGVFWAINDYMGSELALDWRSSQWLALRGRFDYRWSRQFLQGYVNAQQYFREGGRRDLTLRSDNGWQPGERTQVRIGGQYASSNDFVQQNTYDPNELNRVLQSDGFVTHRFENGGNVSLGASRKQEILADRVTTTLPGLNVTLPAITLASPRIGGLPRDVVWTTSGRYESTSVDNDELGSPLATARDTRTQGAGLTSNIRFGNLSFAQSVTGRDAGVDAKPAVPVEEGDSLTTPLAATTTRSLDWNASVNYRQELIGSLRITPSLSVGGGVLESPRTRDEALSKPVTMNFGAAVEADLFGFWPGVGTFERFRHRISPRIAYNFRPEPTQTAFQDSVFGETTRATNALQISFSQTFEGKRPVEESADSVAAPASDDEARSGEPRRLPGQQPVRLLSITTSAIAYDFERASRGEDGLTTTSISNSIASDLLRNLSLNVTHSLFRPIDGSEATAADRAFDLHLERVNARFGVSGESWLFRWLRIGGESETETASEAALDTVDTDQLLPESTRGMVPGAGSSRGMQGMGRVGSTGSWRADFDYSLQRPRDPLQDQNQMVSASMAFQPTANWSVGWQTGYSISDSEFQNNALTLTRALHRWQADFRVLRAQNGNFSFEFEARLSDLPDLRIPYDQRTRGDVN